MDELRAFFNHPCPSSAQVIRYKGPLTGGMRVTKEDTSNLLNRREEHRRSVVVGGTDYAREVKKREAELYEQREKYRDNKANSYLHGLESLEQLSVDVKPCSGKEKENDVEDMLTEEAMMQVYNKYTFQMKEDTNNLVINDYKQQILDTISAYPAVIVEGPTGCGKTTQVPQWILDDCYQKRKPCKIVVTQPRRIAAISIAKRVAQERGWDVGGVVGYQVGLENRTTNDTCIHYVTTGVLLQKLVASKTLNEYTHIILDEIHERGQEMDFLLLVVKKLLFTKSPHVKVILMSATFDLMSFAEYFKVPTSLGFHLSGCVTVKTKEPMFTVKTFYLDHLIKFGTIVEKATPTGEPVILPKMYHLIVKLMYAFELIDVGEENYDDASEADLPSVLIFLPGINEIEELYSCLTDLELRKKVADPEAVKYNWWVLPLHSTITADEQARVFQRAPVGHRKIILATNIAESSITVPDVKYVVDLCLVKLLVADPETNFTSLELSWASKNSCEQRAGRAGRVRDGRVYRLVSQKLFQSFSQDCKPEIVRCSLERLVLLAKMLDMGTPSDILALAMDPPDLSNIHRTILVLKEVGALKKLKDDVWTTADGDITYMGRIMAKMPLDVRVSKVIVLGYIFGCLDECIIMAAAMSVKNIFNTPFRERMNAYNSKLTWADGTTSDCIALLYVYKVWQHLRQQQYFRQQGGAEAQWARRFYVQARALRELDDMVRELRMRLSREGLEPLAAETPWGKHEISLALKMILAGAFYPHYFLQTGYDEDREREAVRTLGGLDPRTTVYLKNFPSNQPGVVYTSAIKKIVAQHIGEEPRVTFDNNSNKVYLTFSDNPANVKRDKESGGDPTIPGQVVLSVYKSVKARQLRMDIRIPLLPDLKAKALAAMLEEQRQNVNFDHIVPRLPDIDDTHFPLKLSQIISVGKFWAQYDDESTANDLRQIHVELNRAQLLALTSDVSPGDVMAAPYTDPSGTTIHRVRVLKLLPRNMVEVLYIDYGSSGRVSVCNLRELPAGLCSDAPPLAMRCSLAEVAPSPLLEQHARWTRGAQQLFQELTRKGRLIAKVYSVVRGVVSIELLAEGGRISVNEALLKAGFAIPCEESYESKLNHDLRQTATEFNMAQKRAFNKEQTKLAFYELRELQPPCAKDCISDVHLKGPFSPLESTLHNLMYGSRGKQIQIEWNSVNAVVLDTEPQELYSRLIVAGSVGQNESNSTVTLRHTTLMPNIPGLPAIMALLFCPAAELRRDEARTRYVSALCGLGSMPDGTPYFPEHDLLINIDADFDVDDMGSLNHVRHLMDYVLYCDSIDGTPNFSDEFRQRVPPLIRQELLKLIMKRRKHRECEAVVNAWEWRSVPPHEQLDITEPGMLERAEIYPLHAPQELRPLDREYILELKRNNDLLKMFVTRTCVSSDREVKCLLCSTPPMSAHAMRIHLYSNAHRQKEQDYNIND